jgi:hypothetical protein
VSTYGIYPQVKPRRRRWPWIVAAVVVFVGLVCGIGSIFVLGKAAESVDEQIQHGDADKKAAVTITSCKPDALGLWKVGYKVVNDTGRVQDYWMTFEVVDKAGKRVGQGSNVVSSLAPGKTATGEAGTDAQGKGLTCKVVRVD